ncbi:MAG TPA: TylF/MycF/NovP-related O-methyltransferase [Tepidisphaeraceae bacterium]|nr:TylF/MycF/NovP-related O-methyltransferase [Tepidisphaeraceae bacterium]
MPSNGAVWRYTARVGQTLRSVGHARIYRRFREMTMIRKSKYLGNLAIAERVRQVPGCVVECGVWRGGMIAGIASVLGNRREYHLFDSFEGLPPAREIDGPDAIQWQADTADPNYFDNCAAEQRWAEQAMRRAGAKEFQLHRGWFEDTVTQFTPPTPIALLRLDGDWYDSTLVCLEALYDHVHPDGMIVIDDYYTWDGCARAVHDFLSRRKLNARIRQAAPNICIMNRGEPWLEQNEAALAESRRVGVG